MNDSSGSRTASLMWLIPVIISQETFSFLQGVSAQRNAPPNLLDLAATGKAIGLALESFGPAHERAWLGRRRGDWREQPEQVSCRYRRVRNRAPGGVGRGAGPRSQARGPSCRCITYMCGSSAWVESMSDFMESMSDIIRRVTSPLRALHPRCSRYGCCGLGLFGPCEARSNLGEIAGVPRLRPQFEPPLTRRI